MSGFERIRRRFLILQERAAIGEGPARLLALLLLLNFVIPLVFGELLGIGFRLFYTDEGRADRERAVMLGWVFGAIKMAFVLPFGMISFLTALPMIPGILRVLMASI